MHWNFCRFQIYRFFSSYRILGSLSCPNSLFYSHSFLNCYTITLFHLESFFFSTFHSFRTGIGYRTRCEIFDEDSPYISLSIRMFHGSSRSRYCYLLLRILEEKEINVFFLAAILSSSMKKNAGNRPGGVRRQIGGLCEGPLVPLCTQTKPMNLRRKEVVQNEHDWFRTALQIKLLQ